MAGSAYYRGKGLTEVIVIYLSRATYFKLKRIAKAKEWSVQKTVRHILDLTTEKVADGDTHNKPEDMNKEDVKKIKDRLHNL